MLNCSASLTISTSILKALPGKLDIKRHAPSILYVSASLTMSTSILKALPGKLDIKRHSPCILYLPVCQLQVLVDCDSSISRFSGNHGKPGKSLKKVPCMKKLWNLKKTLNNHGKIREFCEII